MSDFKGKNILITGAASGIGRLMAEKIAALGANLILWDIDQDGLNSLRDALKKEGQNLSVYCCDLSDRSAICEKAEMTLSEDGSVDILINNAGVVSGKNLTELSDQDIIRTFSVNTLALFWTVRAFLPAMIQKKSGHIVTVASAAGIVGTSRLVDYTSSKFGAVGFAESLRMELKRLGLNIKTTVVCPYYMSTGMFKGVKTRFPSLLPVLKPDYVSQKIIAAIQKNRSRLILPRFVMFSYLLRLRCRFGFLTG